VGANWFRHWKGQSAEPMTLPDGGTTADFNAYKKAWVRSAEDSLFQTFERALSNYGSGYAVPQPPPPPERFTVRSGGDRIFLEWADNAATAPHFGGYRLYRAVGKPDTLYEMIREWGAADAVHSFEDMTAQRGINHYYYISTKDDGTQNDVAPGVPLESSKFYTMTAEPAFLMRPAEPTYADFKRNIRVVPNPYHINATSIQFGDEQPDQISFFGLPPKCTIRIFTERGDLVKTIHHTNTSGDEKWDCTTEYKQIVVSGLYVAHFEVTEDVVDEATGAAVYRKGDSLYKKFIIIR
jgi:hypothetical protein